MSAYYNEIDPYAAEWLRNLIKAGHIADGTVDTRSIVDVGPVDLRGFVQCHFFAGIGGWSHALRLAEWRDSEPIWTGSCPCQPFSVAGKGLGTDDPRHLWPHFFRLISSCRPVVIMGEQVAGSAGYGWFDGVQSDLESENYASRAVDISACSINAPHIRQRLYWVASDTYSQGRKGLVQGKDFGEIGQWHWRGKEDLFVNGPYVGGDHWPKPLIRKVDDGIPARMGRLRAYGNAIVPQVAAEVIKAFMECRP